MLDVDRIRGVLYSLNETMTYDIFATCNDPTFAI
jgi:hypothetical protein